MKTRKLTIVLIAVTSLIIFFFLPVRKLTLSSPLDEGVYLAKTKSGKEVFLPYVIKLTTLTIDKNPPSLYIIDNTKKRALPINNAEKVEVTGDGVTGRILDWDIKVEQFLPNAVLIRTKETFYYSPFDFLGGAVACEVTAVNKSKNITVRGWVGSESVICTPTLLGLEENLSLMLPEREVIGTYSEFTLIYKNGRKKEYSLRERGRVIIKGALIQQQTPKMRDASWNGFNKYEIKQTLFSLILYSL